jgi:riboflavin transporter FmnP
MSVNTRSTTAGATGTARAEAPDPAAAGTATQPASVRRISRTRVLVRVGMLGAVAFALMFTEFYIPGFPTFLQYDPGDVPTLIGGFAMGPLAGAAVALVKGTLFVLSGKDEAGLLGTTANVAGSLAFVLAASAVYMRYHTRKGALLGLGVGVTAMVATMTVLNYYVFLPAYGLPPAAIPGAVRMTVSFNLVKGLLSSVLTFLVYKKVSAFLHR